MSANRIKITAVIPSIGDRPELLARTISSVAAQQLCAVDVEILVVDASGEDRVRRSDSNLGGARVLVADRRLTAGAARQLGTEEAAAQWVAYCDDDDLWSPIKISQQLAAIARSDRSWSFTGAVAFTAGGRLLSAATCASESNLYQILLRGNCVPGGGSSTLVRKDFILRAGGWDVELRNSEDWEMWLRLARLAPAAYVHAPLVGYRIHAGSKSLDVTRIRSSHQQIRSIHEDEALTLPDLDWMYRRELLMDRAEQARLVYESMPHRAFGSRALRWASALDQRRTTAWLRRREAARFPEGWRETAEHWICRAESVAP